ncbi:MAG: hypothetical protein HY962_06665 [Ignavibacteriae bacterium]|nr:hypothetical protein [Ignavibacteriota bacterium]
MSIPGSDITIHRSRFTSTAWDLLPGAATYRCREHGVEFSEDPQVRNSDAALPYPDPLNHGDIDIRENREFEYTIFSKEGAARAEDVILFFHGLNERSWDKYLPWAYRLVERTGKTVILFPLAFHMNRAPSAWGEPRPMNAVSALRRGRSPALVNASFANAAISTRLETRPQRLLWSGLQTLYDVVSLIEDIQHDTHLHIAPGARYDIFAYSIGCFLSEILLLANPGKHFDASRAFLFCGGSTLDRMAPNSRFILDSDATIALYSYYTVRLEAEERLDPRIAHYLSEAHDAGPVFRMLLSYQKHKAQREQWLRERGARIHAVALHNDEVVPPIEVINTLQGDQRDIPCTVDVLDFPYPYTHVVPFPLQGAAEDDVNRCFDDVFDRAAGWLS